MHLCIVTETYAPEVNGVAMTLARLAGVLRARGHRVSIVRPRHPSKVTGAHNGETMVPGVPLPGYRGLRFGLPCASRLRKLWRHDRPDVLYVATEGPLGLSAIRAGRQLGIAVTSGFHTNFHEYMRHYKLPLLERAVLAFLRKTHNRTRRTFAPSEGVIRQLDAIGIRGTRLLGRGVDRGLFHPAKRDPELRKSWGLPGGEGCVAIFVSRLAAEKNIPLAVEAFRKIREREPSAVCVFVGDGPERAKLEAAHPELIFAGMQTGEDLARHYASGDVFVFPSMTETFGNVVTEAMASGLVVCAFDYAAPGKFIRNGVNGYLAEYGSASAFLSRVDQAICQQADWPLLRESARQATQSLDWNEIVGQFERDLEEAIAESDCPSAGPSKV